MEEIVLILLTLVGILIIVRCNRELAQQTQYRTKMTDEKLRWMHDIKAAVSTYCSLVEQYKNIRERSTYKKTSPEQLHQIKKEIVELDAYLKLYLNWAQDGKILTLLNELTTAVLTEDLLSDFAYRKLLDEYQKMLKFEWEVVRKEVAKGRPLKKDEKFRLMQ